MSKRTQFIALFIFLYVFRVLFGLSLTFFGANMIELDAFQNYLIGLKFYTTHTWPFFGADQYLLNNGYHSQIPGALHGWVVGGPFYLLPIPEAPFLFLNLLSLSTIAFLAWYIVRRLPELSWPFVFTWIAILPWTLNRSTHVFNPSYLLFGSVLFFVGFLETIPRVSRSAVPLGWAFGLMGLGIGWNMQFHLSWVLLLPLVLLVFVWRRKSGEVGASKEIGSFLSGVAIPLVFLIPTLIEYGWTQGSSGILNSSQSFNIRNFRDFFTIMARYLSFACFEMPRFIGSGTGERLQFFREASWLWQSGAFLILLGWIQPFVLLFAVWFKDKHHPEAKTIGLLTLAGFVYVWFCFWFTENGPAAHMYYAFLPLVTVYYFYVWSRFVAKPGWKKFGLVCLAASFWFQTGFMIKEFQKGTSLYADRAKIVRAIQEKDYRLLSERRPWALY